MEHNKYKIAPEQKVEIHPAAELMPMMNEQEMETLVADIKENGQKVSLAFLDGKLLDGRNRLEACRRLNIEANALDMAPNTDPYTYVISRNVARRHLSESQRATVAVKYMSLIEKVPEGQKRRDIAAKAYNVSPRLVQDAKKLSELDPKAFEDVFAGRLSLHQALTKKKTANDYSKIFSMVLHLVPSEKAQELELMIPSAGKKLGTIIQKQITDWGKKPLEDFAASLENSEESNSDSVERMGA